MDGIKVSDYFSVMDNPVAPIYLWTTHYWNKLQLSGGCYWKKCRFCDTSLDYIKNNSQDTIKNILSNICRLIKFSNSRYFHFTDEATPPALLQKLSNELINSNLKISYYTNIRFDKPFANRGFAEQLSSSGCICLTGGLETLTNETLKKINKGFSIESAVKAMKTLSESGILLHAYLMYGIPGQTENDLIDFLEIARQIYNAGIMRTAYLHRFALTFHSSYYADAKIENLNFSKKKNPFANNDIKYRDHFSGIYDRYSKPLQTAIYNFNRGTGLDITVAKWFDFKTPKPRILKNYIQDTLYES